MTLGWFLVTVWLEGTIGDPTAYAQRYDPRFNSQAECEKKIAEIERRFPKDFVFRAVCAPEKTRDEP
jgi:hypothetical protein